MNRTKIEWCDYTINPVKGLCKNDCWYCYAKRMYERFKWNPKIRLDTDMFYDLEKISKPSKIFVGSTHEIFGHWISDEWIKEIIFHTSILSWHTFIFLTKFPQRYLEFNFPDNCWLGTTITGVETAKEVKSKYDSLNRVKGNIKFISFEPLFELPCYFMKTDWVIIGGLSGYKYKRPEGAIDRIISFYSFRHIPIFIKNNLKWHEKIQEFPND